MATKKKARIRRRRAMVANPVRRARSTRKAYKKNPSRKRRKFRRNPGLIQGNASGRMGEDWHDSYKVRAHDRNPGRPPRRRRFKKNPSGIGGLVIGLGAGVTTAIAGPKVANLAGAKGAFANGILAMLGLGLAFYGWKKDSFSMVGAGMGMVIGGASRAIVNQVPQLAGDDELTPEQQSLLLNSMANEMLQGENEAEQLLLGGPMSGDDLDGDDLDGDDLDGDDLDGDDLDGEVMGYDEMDGPMSGPMSGDDLDGEEVYDMAGEAPM